MGRAPLLATLCVLACSEPPAPGLAEAAITYDRTGTSPFGNGPLAVQLWSGHTADRCFSFQTVLLGASLNGVGLRMFEDAHPGWGGPVFDPITGTQSGFSDPEVCYPATWGAPPPTALPGAGAARATLVFQARSQSATLEAVNFFAPLQLAVRAPTGAVRRGETLTLALAPPFEDIGAVGLAGPSTCNRQQVAYTLETGATETTLRVTVPADLPDACDGSLDLFLGAMLRAPVLRCENLARCEASVKVEPPRVSFTLGR